MRSLDDAIAALHDIAERCARSGAHIDGVCFQSWSHAIRAHRMGPCASTSLRDAFAVYARRSHGRGGSPDARPSIVNDGWLSDSDATLAHLVLANAAALVVVERVIEFNIANGAGPERDAMRDTLAALVDDIIRAPMRDAAEPFAAPSIALGVAIESALGDDAIYAPRVDAASIARDAAASYDGRLGFIASKLGEARSVERVAELALSGDIDALADAVVGAVDAIRDARDATRYVSDDGTPSTTTAQARAAAAQRITERVAGGGVRADDAIAARSSVGAGRLRRARRR